MAAVISIHFAFQEIKKNCGVTFGCRQPVQTTDRYLRSEGTVHEPLTLADPAGAAAVNHFSSPVFHFIPLIPTNTFINDY